MNEIENVKRLREGLPAASPEARDAARAALMERFEPPAPEPAKRRRVFRRRAFGLAGAVAVTAVAILVAVGSGDGPTVKPEVASAADLKHLAKVSPHFLIAGAWQVVSVEAYGDGGQTQFYDSADPGLRKAERKVVIRWHPYSLRKWQKRLAGRGYTRARPRSVTIEHPERVLVHRLETKPAPVYVLPHNHGGFFKAVGLWQEDGRTMELRAVVPSFAHLQRRLERLVSATSDEWLTALQPGGAEYLAAVGSRVVEETRVQRGYTPDGKPLYTVKAGVVGTPQTLRHPDLTKAVPIIYRDGDKVKVVVKLPPDSRPPAQSGDEP